VILRFRPIPSLNPPTNPNPLVLLAGRSLLSSEAFLSDEALAESEAEEDGEAWSLSKD
jgi:hypothetical protein